MTKSELKQLIRECLNEIDIVRPPTMELKVISVATGYENEIKEYIPEMVESIENVFDEDVTFTKNFKEPYETENKKLPDNHIEVKTRFTITGLTDETDKVEIIESLKEIQEQLTMLSISKNLANIDFYFTIEK